MMTSDVNNFGVARVEQAGLSDWRQAFGAMRVFPPPGSLETTSSTFDVYIVESGMKISCGRVTHSQCYNELKEKIISARPSLRDKEFIIYSSDASSKYLVECDSDLKFIKNSITIKEICEKKKTRVNEDRVLFEAHLGLPRIEKEIRRFYLDHEKAKRFTLLKENLETIFSPLQSINSYTIHYETQLGLIPVSTDSELAVFLEDSGGTKVIFISEQANKRIFEVSIQLPQPEFRVLYIDQETVKSFSSLKKKVASLSPSLEGQDFEIHWTDEAGRDIVMGSDDELSYFLDIHSGTFKVAIILPGKRCSMNAESENSSLGDKVDEALEKLMSLGFHNEEDWLRTLLVVRNGEIQRALQTISCISRPWKNAWTN